LSFVTFALVRISGLIFPGLSTIFHHGCPEMSNASVFNYQPSSADFRGDGR
jgi:hypothetical protein